MATSAVIRRPKPLEEKSHEDIRREGERLGLTFGGSISKADMQQAIALRKESIQLETEAERLYGVNVQLKKELSLKKEEQNQMAKTPSPPENKPPENKPPKPVTNPINIDKVCEFLADSGTGAPKIEKVRKAYAATQDTDDKNTFAKAMREHGVPNVTILKVVGPKGALA